MNHRWVEIVSLIGVIQILDTLYQTVFETQKLELVIDYKN